MADLGSTQPIVIRKKVVGHGGHHGGAWKVAYADFVTAMMALFIVLWLMNTSPAVKQAVSGYFNDPRGKSAQVGSGQAGTGETLAVAADNLQNLKKEIEQAMKKMPELEALKDQVAMTVTGEGLRIELLENEKGVFFDRGSAMPTALGIEILRMLAQELGKLPNSLLIEGHTDSRPYTGRPSYSNWELSADRANAARRLMLENGLRPDQVKQIRGYADQHLRKPDAPEDASNRRISVLVQYANAKAPDAADPSGKPAAVERGAGAEPHG